MAEVKRALVSTGIDTGTVHVQGGRSPITPRQPACQNGENIGYIKCAPSRVYLVLCTERATLSVKIWVEVSDLSVIEDLRRIQNFTLNSLFHSTLLWSPSLLAAFR